MRKFIILFLIVFLVHTLQLKAAEPLNLTAEGDADTKEKIFTIGSTDPNSNFEFELEISSKGASVRKATFSQFDDRDHKNPQPLVILSPIQMSDGTEILSMANKEFIFIEQKLQLRLNKLQWNSRGIEKNADGSQNIVLWALIKDVDANEPVVKITKTYKVMLNSYDFFCELSVENLSNAEQKIRFNLIGPIGIGREGIRADMRKVVAGFRNSDGQMTSERLKLQKLKKDESLKNRQLIKNGDDFLWAAVTNKYFTAIVVPLPEDEETYCQWIKQKTGQYYDPDGDPKNNSGDETVGVDLKTASVTLGSAGQSSSTKNYNFHLYLGPKDKSLFDKNEFYRNLGFVHAIDFTACCICPAAVIRPIAFGILALMKWMYGFIGNYGIVIIILVLIVRIVLHPVTKAGQVRMNRFTKILSAPEIQEIKKKYAKNRMEMQKRISAFQRERGVSPADAFFGMLPMLVQMPIWISLWSSINTSVALRGEGFLPFWITDLSVPDALIRFSAITIPILGAKITSFNLLPILMGVAFYLQQKMMPQQPAATPEAAQQQKIMKVMMLVMFPLLLYSAPSGVSLYIMASTFGGVIEQHVIRKHIREKEQAESQGLVAVTSKTGGKVKKKKPKPFFRS